VFKTLAQEGRAVLTSLHDLSLAGRYCTRLILLGAGRIIADGAPRDVLTPALLAEAFRLEAEVIDTPQGPIVQPLGVLT
jgi:iron complex transport system ATP-binding protein